MAIKPVIVNRRTGAWGLMVVMSGNPRAGARGAGFTLIEAMVVIAIISVLAAIAVPVYERYTAVARAQDVAEDFHAAISAVADAMSGAQAGQATLIALGNTQGVPAAAPASGSGVPVLSDRLMDPAAFATTGGASPINFAYIGSSGTTFTVPAYCGEVDVVGEGPKAPATATGAWINPGITRSVYLSVGVGRTCGNDAPLGQDIINAIVANGSSAPLPVADSTGHTVSPCLSGVTACYAEVGSNGSITP
ncbi:pilin [Acidiferrobacter thiooxydans]|nr:prepilin-type N-terminal cleavage/methylation domain-containing protein [Acidiferrobacter thiooxydans]